MTYLDYQATTPLDPAVREAMLPYLGDLFGNPHSEHRHGWAAAAGVAAARADIAALIGAPPENVVFTSGATEANNWALKGVLTAPGQTRRRLITVATEHSAILEPARYLESLGAELTVLPIAQDGLLRLEDLEAALDDSVALVSVMLVNNEIGVIQPLADIAALAHQHGALVHSDAAQAFGKIPTNVDELGIDFMSISGHKIYGPKGVGTLYVRPGVGLAPLMHGGGQEPGRSGTLAPALCAGLGAAARIAASRMAEDAAHARALWAQTQDHLARSGLPHRINGSTRHRWPGNLSLTLHGVDGPRLISSLRDISISSGAACASSAGRPSHVLAALGLTRSEIAATLRIGWGRFTTPQELDTVLARILDAARAQRPRAA